jgi:hypothetical protein
MYDSPEDHQTAADFRAEVAATTDEDAILGLFVYQLGCSLAGWVIGAAHLGHASLAGHALYVHPADYPPQTPEEAGAQVVYETLTGTPAKQIVERHPWLDHLAATLIAGALTTGGKE